MTRRIWRMAKAGSLDRLSSEQEPMGELGDETVRVAVRAVGLNFADVFACLGLYSATPAGAFVPGLEFCGVVEAVGPRVDGLRIGDRVFGLTRFGAYATRVDVEAGYVHPLPVDWSFAEGAAYPVQALTAWYAIRELGACQAGHTVLVHSAAGGVGLHALGMLTAIGAAAVATVGDAAKIPFLVEHAGLSRDRIIVRDRRRFAAQLDDALLAVGRKGFDLVLDAVAGPFFQPAYRRLAPAGRMVIFGAADFMPGGRRPNWLKLAARYLSRPRVDPIEMVSENRSVMGFNLIWMWDQAGRLTPAYTDMASMHPPAPHVGRRFPFTEAPLALQYLQSGGSVGKVVLDVGGEPA